MNDAAPAPIPADLCAFVTGGVSLGLGTRDAAMRPHAVRAVGLRCEPARLVVFVPRSQATDTLADIGDNGRVSLVANEPSTHRTYQLKGDDAHVVEPVPADHRLVLAYRDAFGAALDAIGWPRAFTEALLQGIDEPLVGIAFTPTSVFDATPGPRAGGPLERAR